ncbi:MAG: DNA methyltransferase [Spirochaetes bacterium]|nr:MAG: DNA methyltransferase [Spirochaetota bacterium]
MAGIFTDSVCSLLNSVPPGFVVTYGGLAAAAGSPRGARQVVRILHTQSRVRNLPWHRVVAAGGRIALNDPMAAGLQKELLLSEGVQMDNIGRVDMKQHNWDFSGSFPD